jgi:sarcosine oxidase subunit gamma
VAERHALPQWTQPGRYGAPGSGVTLSEATIAAAWNVQGDVARASFADESSRLFGVALPTAANGVARSVALVALWLGPGSWLLVAGGASPLVDFAAKRDALNAAGGALFDVSVARIAWTIAGPRAEVVLAKGCPLDFDRRAFAADTCAQSLYGHIGVLIVRGDDASTFTLAVPRSYARDAWHSLLGAAAEHGVEIRAPAPFG